MNQKKAKDIEEKDTESETAKEVTNENNYINPITISACNAENPVLQSTPPGTENVKSIKVVPVEDRDQPVVGTTFPLQVIGQNDDGSSVDLTGMLFLKPKIESNGSIRWSCYK